MDTTPIYYKDLIRPDNSITDLISQLETLMREYDAARAKIQSSASELAKGMQGVSGASEAQRDAIRQAAVEADRLSGEMGELTARQKEARDAIERLRQARQEENQLTKLRVQLAKSEEGSYNQLSAQYRLLKIRINEMGEAEGKDIQKKRELEKQAKAVYERMNELQKATGKYTLQVGNYELALGKAVGVNTQFISVLQDSSKASETFHGIMGAMTSPIGLVVSAMGLATGALKSWGSTIHDTQKTGDAFDVEMAGWSASWEVFRKSVSAVDFRGFIAGAIEAARVGRELKMVLDEAFERSSSIRLQRAAMSEENEILLERLRNQQLSNEERIKAGKDYLANMGPIYQQEEDLAKTLRDQQLAYLWGVTTRQRGLTEEQEKAEQEKLATYIREYNINRESIKQAREYLDAQEKITTTTKSLSQAGAAAVQDLYTAQIEKAQNIIDSATDEQKAMAEIVKQYNLTNDAEVEAYVKAEENYLNAKAAIHADNRRIYTQINSLENQRRTTALKVSKDIAQAYRDEAEEQARAAQAEADAYERMVQEEGRKREEARKREESAYMEQLQFELKVIQLEIAGTKEGTEEMLRLRLGMIRKQQEIELEANRRAVKERRVDEALINAKYDRMREEATGKASKDAGLAAAEGLTEGASEGAKHYGDIWDVLGVGGKMSSQLKDAISTTIGAVVDSIGQLINAWQESAQAAVDAADKQVDSAQRVLDAEREAAAEGYANNVRRAEQELALAKKNQERALKEKERANRAQLALDTITQASSLITASANIWSGFSEIPIVGPALAVAALALMWGSFAASKIKAIQATKESYGEGTVELLEGGSHASGHDISLGRKADGTERRAEGGEFFAVINKRNSRRYRDVIPDVINAFNDGTFADKYQRAGDGMAGLAVQMIGGADLSTLERGVDAIRRQGEVQRSVEGGDIVLRYKNLTRRIKS